MTGVVPVLPKFQFESSAGAPLANGTLDVYLAGTTTRTNTWQDLAQTTLNTNPIVLNSRGEATIYFDPALTYKFVLKNAGGVEQYTLDNLSGPASAASFGFVSVKSYGAVGNGVVDDTAAFLVAMAYCETNGLPLQIPSGTYNLATWATRSSTFVMLRGAGLRSTVIKGPTSVGAHFVQMTGGVFDVEGITFERFDHVGYSEATVDIVRVADCRARYNRSMFFRSADVTDFPSSAVTTSILQNNEVYRSGGFQIHGAVTQGVATGNVMKEVQRWSAIWSGNLAQTFGISFGDTDNNNSSVAQALVGGITVTGNSIDGMNNATTAGTFNTTNAIQVTGISAVVTGNVIKNMSATDGSNCEAIYCKAQNIVIGGNTIVDGTITSASIAIKGTYATSGPIGKHCVVSDNVITARNQSCDSGIVVFESGDIDITGNKVSGMALDSIKFLNYPARVNVLDNHITNNGGTYAINFQCGEIASTRIEGNTIDGVLATTGNMWPIRLNAALGQIKEINVTAGGSGYTSTPTVTISGGGGGVATAQATVVGGQVVGICKIASDNGFTSVPTVTITGGGGIGATATAVLSAATINDVSICRNKIRWSPQSSLTSASAIHIQADSATTFASGGFVINDNEATADASTTLTTILGVNFHSPTTGFLRDARIDGLHMTAPDVTWLRPVTVNSSLNLYSQAANYNDLTVRNVSVNGRSKRILSKLDVEDNRVTAVVDCAGKAVGQHLIGHIPFSVLITRAKGFFSTAPTSGTSTGRIAFTVGTAGTKNILADTVVTAFAANTFFDCIPDGTAANAKRVFVSSGLVPVYLEVTVEAITAGVLTVILETEALY